MDHAARTSRKVSANWPRALVLGTSLFATLNSSWAQDTGVVSSGKANPLYPNEAEIKSRFNGIMNARVTDPALSLVVEREEDQIT
jgi:hypothetical protein